MEIRKIIPISNLVQKEDFGHIYIAGDVSGGPIKVGYTKKDPRKRMQQLKTGFPGNLEVLYLFDFQTLGCEQSIHKILKYYARKYGEVVSKNEWYDRSKLDFVLYIIKHHIHTEILDEYDPWPWDPIDQFCCVNGMPWTRSVLDVSTYGCSGNGGGGCNVSKKCLIEHMLRIWFSENELARKIKDIEWSKYDERTDYMSPWWHKFF